MLSLTAQHKKPGRAEKRSALGGLGPFRRMLRGLSHHSAQWDRALRFLNWRQRKLFVIARSERDEAISHFDAG